MTNANFDWKNLGSESAIGSAVEAAQKTNIDVEITESNKLFESVVSVNTLKKTSGSKESQSSEESSVSYRSYKIVEAPQNVEEEVADENTQLPTISEMHPYLSLLFDEVFGMWQIIPRRGISDSDMSGRNFEI